MLPEAGAGRRDRCHTCHVFRGPPHILGFWERGLRPVRPLFPNSSDDRSFVLPPPRATRSHRRRSARGDRGRWAPRRTIGFAQSRASSRRWGTIFHPRAATCGTIALATIRSSVASPGLSPLRATAESSTRSRCAGRRARESDRRVRAHRGPVRAHRDRLLSFWIGVLPTRAALDARRVTVRLERAPLDSGRSASDIVMPFITDDLVGRDEKGELV